MKFAVALALLCAFAIAIGASIDYREKTRPTPLTVQIGTCAWRPPTPTAAVLAVGWFYGLPPDTLWSDYEAAMANQFLAAGQSPHEATASVGALEHCFDTYVPEKHS